MAVSAIDPFTTTTVGATKTPTATVQPTAASIAPATTASKTTVVPSQVPQMDPLAFQQPQMLAAPITATSEGQNFQIYGYDTGANGQRRPILGVDQTYGTPVYGSWEADPGYSPPAPPSVPATTFTPGVYNTSGVNSPTAGQTYLNPGQYAPQAFGNIDTSTFAGMTQAQRDALAQQMINYGYGFNQLQDTTIDRMNDPGASFHGWVGGESLLDPSDLEKFRLLTNTDSYGLLRSGAGKGYTADSWAALTPQQQATIAGGGPSPADIDRANYTPSYSTIQGGQTFTDPVAGQNAFDAILQQMAGGGPPLFTSQQPGGTINSDALRQLQTGLSDASGQSRVYSEFLPGGGADYRLTPPGTASDIGGGGNVPGGGGTMPNPWVPGTGTGGGGSGGTGGTGTDTGGTGSGLGPGLSLIDPSNDLRNFQITPGAMLDRFKLAGEQFDTFANATSPQYQAALRDANRAAAATGRLGSGMLRTSYGDLANQRNLQLDTQRENLFQNALLGSVQDAQTQFEDYLRSQAQLSGMQNQAFNQGIQGATLQEALTSGAFSRALQQLGAGNQGNPADAMLTLSKIFGDQSSAAGSAMSGLLQSIMSGGGSTDTLLRQILANQQRPSGTLPQSSQTIYDTPVFS